MFLYGDLSSCLRRFLRHDEGFGWDFRAFWSEAISRNSREVWKGFGVWKKVAIRFGAVLVRGVSRGFCVLMWFLN